MNDTLDEVLRKRVVFLLADPKFDTRELFKRLRALNLPLRVAVCENLGYPDERILIDTLESPPPITSAMYSLMIGDF
jgi:cobalt-precorrin-7 (C5)-methyltransferase